MMRFTAGQLGQYEFGLLVPLLPAEGLLLGLQQKLLVFFEHHDVDHAQRRGDAGGHVHQRLRFRVWFKLYHQLGLSTTKIMTC